MGVEVVLGWWGGAVRVERGEQRMGNACKLFHINILASVFFTLEPFPRGCRVGGGEERRGEEGVENRKERKGMSEGGGVFG